MSIVRPAGAARSDRSSDRDDHRGEAKRREQKSRWALLATTLGVLIVDLISKFAASSRLKDGPIELPGPLDLQLSYNPGVAFGLGSSLPLWVVLAITTAVAVGVAVSAWKGWLPNPWAAGLIVGGALGNVIDRAEAGTVIDMLHTGWWPTFNVADVAVVAGAFLMAFSALTQPVSDEPE